MPYSSNYRKIKQHDDRKLESSKMKPRYPNYILVVLEKSKTCTIDQELKVKWLVPGNMLVLDL